MNFVVCLFVLIACALSFGFSQTIDSHSDSSAQSDSESDEVQTTHGIVHGVRNTVKDGLSKILPQTSREDRYKYKGGVLNGFGEGGIINDGVLEGDF